MATRLPVKFALYATAFSRYAPLNVEPLKSDSLISAAVKLALLYQSFRLIKVYNHMFALRKSNQEISVFATKLTTQHKFRNSHFLFSCFFKSVIIIE